MPISFFPPPSLTREQERIRSYMNMGYTCGYHEDLPKLVRKGEYIIEDSHIFYRGDKQSPFSGEKEGNIFSQGFDVYSLSRWPLARVPKSWASWIRMPKKEDSPSSILGTLCLTACCAVSCPVFFTVIGAYALYADPCCGRSRYDKGYYSNWSALSFTKKYHNASVSNITIPYPDKGERWNYVVYLERCIDFQKFSQKQTAEESDDVNEVLPIDLHNQRVYGDHVIGAYSSLQGNTFLL